MVASASQTPSPMTLTGAASASPSSWISPTISSSTSSRVTMPLVPPNSSTTMARWTWRRCISFSRREIFICSGTKNAGRRCPSRPTAWMGPRRSSSTISRTMRMPTTLSTVPWKTGMRL
jgi:hypothetical protein